MPEALSLYADVALRLWWVPAIWLLAVGIDRLITERKRQR